jgi:hypothetical protein
MPSRGEAQTQLHHGEEEDTADKVNLPPLQDS